MSEPLSSYHPIMVSGMAMTNSQSRHHHSPNSLSGNVEGKKDEEHSSGHQQSPPQSIPLFTMPGLQQSANGGIPAIVQLPQINYPSSSEGGPFGVILPQGIQ